MRTETTTSGDLAAVARQAEATRKARTAFGRERDALIKRIVDASAAGDTANDIARAASAGLSRPLVLGAIKAARTLPRVTQVLRDAGIPVGLGDPLERAMLLSAGTRLTGIVHWGDDLDDLEASNQRDAQFAAEAVAALEAAGYRVEGDPTERHAEIVAAEDA